MLQLAHTLKRLRSIVATLLITLSVTNCATSDGGFGSGTTRTGAGKVTVCKSGDTLVSSSNQCLQDSAACYELSNGQWCTGERGNSCPAGSEKIPDGAQCPNGTRCIQIGEGLNCAIQIR